jgi:AraC-like DNA-binding protein
MPKVLRLRQKTFFYDPSGVVVVFREKAQQPMELHRHEFLEIAVVLAGCGIYTTMAGQRKIQAGDVMVVNSRHSHGYEQTSTLELANVLIREDVLREVEKDLGALPGYHSLFTLERVRRRGTGSDWHVRLANEDLRQVAGWISAIEQESHRLHEGGALLAKTWLVILIGFLARAYGKQAANSGHADMRLGRVLAAIDAHPEKPFRLAGMAKAAAMSDRSFVRHFKEATGFSPMDYVLRKRVHRATLLLSDPGPKPSITEIAFACGFNDSNYFTRQFRRVIGSSPRSFLTLPGIQRK